MKSSQVPLKNLPMVGTTTAGHIHIMIIEHLMKLDSILKIVGCTVTKRLDQNKHRFPPGRIVDFHYSKMLVFSRRTGGVLEPGIFKLIF